MKAKDALISLAKLSSEQWGLFTTRQAAARGVSRLDLSRLAAAELIERVRHGVYRDAGAAGDEFEPLCAAWLATAPEIEAAVRLRRDPDAVVIGISAAVLHGIGDLREDEFQFGVSKRRQSQQQDVRFKLRQIDSSEITVRHGLPVTSIERTLADLFEANTDMTHVADALGDGLRRGEVDVEQLAIKLAPLAAREGLHRGDGQALLERLLKLSGMDAESTASRIAAVDTLALRVLDHYLKRVVEQAAQIPQQLAPPQFKMLQSLQSAILDNGEDWSRVLSEITGLTAVVDAHKQLSKSLNAEMLEAMHASIHGSDTKRR